MKSTFYALTIGSDAGIFKDNINPTSKRFLEYCHRCGKHFTICYTPPGYKALTVDGRLEIFPTNSRNRLFFVPDAVLLGMKIIRRFKPKVIITQDTFVFGLVGLILKKLSGLPLVVHYHSGFHTNNYWLAQKGHHRLLALLGLFVSRCADAIRTVSTDIQRDLLAKGFDPNRVFYATPPVESEGFLKVDKAKEEEIITRFNLNPLNTFAFVGRLSEEKNLPLMLRAVSRTVPKHPELRLLIIGKGPDENKLHNIVLEQGLENYVIFVGHVPYDDLKNYIRAASALLITSNYEGTAKVIKEAAFAGRTTISTNTSGVSDTIKDGETGFIVPIGDERILSMAMDDLLSHPEKAVSMGFRAREHILENFSYEKGVDRIVAVWKCAVASKK
ncbi:glycosyltransferase family 4 protein [Thermodesulfobacteriota bacterium]